MAAPNATTTNNNPNGTTTIATVKPLAAPASNATTATKASPTTDDQKLNTPTKSDVNATLKKNKTIWINGPTPPFDDHFKKVKQLGEAGQFGITFRCVHKKTNERYAVKLLNKNRFYRIPHKYRPRYLRAMHDEIDILSTLSHPNIISLENVYEDKHTLYIVMEECRGGELFQRIVEKGQYSEKDASLVIKQLLDALKYMHEENQIVHCDLKPDNILFLNKSNNSPVKIIDFGMSKVLPRLQYLTHLCGTPYYTAPEVIRDKKYNHQCDMWSIGVILYVMIFGYPPFYVDPEKYGKHERKAIYEKIKKGFIARVRSTEKHGFGPWFPDHIPVSSEVKHLISKLLQYRVQNRYTANEALNDPWILNLGGTIDPNVDQTVISSSFISSLAKFNNACQFKLIVVKLFREQFTKMRPKHFKQLEDIFTEMDTDGDGIVSFSEFEAAVLRVPDINIQKKYIAEIFNSINIDNNQGIKFEDLLNALVHDYLVSCDERLYAAFRELDDDDDGKITTQQLKDKLKEYDPLGDWDRAIDIINQQTLDANGVIDYEEFLLNLHPNFEEQPHWLPNVFKKMKSIVPAATPKPTTATANSTNKKSKKDKKDKKKKKKGKKDKKDKKNKHK